MDQEMQSIIQKAQRIYHAELVNEHTLGNSENIVLEMTADQPIILRVSEYSEAKKAHVDFELAWMMYLSSELDNIVQPVLGKHQNLVEVIECDRKYIVCAFEKAKGKIVNINDPKEYNESLFYELGSIMGRMHSMTKKYNDTHNRERFAWYNGWSFWSRYNKVIDEEVYSYEKRYIRDLHLLPKTKDTYGIIHADIQWANFFVDHGHVSIFDFDDCEFNWYATDIAITLFQFVQQSGISCNNKSEREKFAEIFLLSFLKGYVQANSISEYWIMQFDMFMKYRRTTTYKFIQNVFGDRTVNPHQEYLDWLKQEIMQDTSFVDIDYQKIIKCIPSI